MKKILSLVVACAFAVMASAQSAVSFKVNEEGAVVSAAGQGYAISSFDGQTASQIFQTLFANVGKVYSNAQGKVVITADGGNKLTVKASDTKLTYQVENKETIWITGTYTLVFNIKDGKVRVSAPDVDETLLRTSDNTRYNDFSKFTAKFFSNGAVNPKNKAQVDYTEAKLNGFVNGVLTGSYVNTDDAEW